jgi:hypothetical protein
MTTDDLALEPYDLRALRGWPSSHDVHDLVREVYKTRKERDEAQVKLDAVHKLIDHFSFEAYNAGGLRHQVVDVLDVQRILDGVSIDLITEKRLDDRIDEVHGPGAAAALNKAIADGSIFSEADDE